MTVDEALDRIAAKDPAINAFITVAGDAREQARALEDERRQGRIRGPLHGAPISLKDIIDVRGMPTTAASHARAGSIAASDAPLVTRLRSAGAVIIGKCNLHEFALGTTNDESAYRPHHRHNCVWENSAAIFWSAWTMTCDPVSRKPSIGCALPGPLFATQPFPTLKTFRRPTRISPCPKPTRTTRRRSSGRADIRR